METSTTKRPASDVGSTQRERSRLSVAFAVLVGATIVAGTVLAVALLTGRSGDTFVGSPGETTSEPRQIAILTDGYVEVDWRDVPPSDLGPLREWRIITTPDLDANLRAQGFNDLPDVDYEQSFLLLAEWDGCPRDRALVLMADQRLWVEQEETNTDCEAPEWVITPVVIDWSTTGDTFTYGQAGRPVQLVRDRAVHQIDRLAPAARRHGVDDGLREPGPDQPEITLATSAADRDRLVEHPAFPTDGQSILDQASSPVLLVVTNGCAPAWALATTTGATDSASDSADSGDLVLLRPALDWADCEQTTSSALFVLDDRFPDSPFTVAFDDFVNPSGSVELAAGG